MKEGKKESQKMARIFLFFSSSVSWSNPITIQLFNHVPAIIFSSRAFFKIVGG